MNDHKHESSNIYVRLMGEGTTVYRPIQALKLDDSIFRLPEATDYNPEEEHWEFPPGSVVRCASRSFGNDNEIVMVAESLVTE